MPKLRQRIGSDPEPGADAALRHLVTEAIRHCPKSRAQIAEELELRLQEHITVHMLNDWTCAAKKPARFPASFIEAFCEVTGDDRLARRVMGSRLRRLTEFAERELAATKEERERERLRAQLLREKEGMGNKGS